MPMKLPFLLVLSCTFCPFGWAQSGESDHASLSLEAIASVQESAVPREAAAPTRLRDVFQVSASKTEEPAKPYRLSTEERLRLREQLRGQFVFDVPKQ